MTDKKRILVLATGGTVAGTGEPGRVSGYEPGQLGVEELIAQSDALDQSPVKAQELILRQVMNKNSDDIGWEERIILLGEIRAAMEDEDIGGIVVLHGTDTMEETALFLNRTLDLKKPLILTGAMRPATALSPDGPLNISCALAVAGCDEAAKKGVLVTMDGRIYGAEGVFKADTSGCPAFDGGLWPEGWVMDGAVSISYMPDCRVKRVQLPEGCPRPDVTVVYFHAGASVNILDWAERCDGLVIAGAGSGEFSRMFCEKIEKLKMPVVISSRVNRSRVEEDMLLVPGAIPARFYPPHKAAILLELALVCGLDRDGIREMFE